MLACEAWTVLLAAVGASVEAGVGVPEREIGLAVAALGALVALAVGLSWVCAKTNPAPRTSKGVARAMIRRVLFLGDLGAKPSSSVIWNHSGLEFSGLMIFFLSLAKS